MTIDSGRRSINTQCQNVTFELKGRNQSKKGFVRFLSGETILENYLVG